MCVIWFGRSRGVLVELSRRGELENEVLRVGGGRKMRVLGILGGGGDRK